MNRRRFLKHGLGLSAGVVVAGTFEVITRIEPAAPSGVTRAWVRCPS